jgi:hypothetical protein
LSRHPFHRRYTPEKIKTQSVKVRRPHIRHRTFTWLSSLGGLAHIRGCFAAKK